MGLWQRFRKSWAIRAYLRDCPELFLRRYGFEEHYSTGRVLATLSAARLSAEFRDYACALFAEEEQFIDWALSEHQRARKVPSWIRKATRRQDELRPLFPSAAPPSRRQARELYRRLRAEVAERYRHGSLEFLPRRGSARSSDLSPLRDSPYAESAFRWYK